MKKQELAKRHAIFFHPLIIPMLFRDFLKSVLQILILLLECTILFRYSKREDATKELTEAVEVTVLIKVLSPFGIIFLCQLLLFVNPKGKRLLMFQEGDKDAIEKLSKRTVKVISSFCCQ